MTFGYLTEAEIGRIVGARDDESAHVSDGEAGGPGWTAGLAGEGRAARIGTVRWVAAERIGEARALWSEDAVEPEVEAPSDAASQQDPTEARREILRGRMALAGPVTLDGLVVDLGLPRHEIQQSLLALEGEGTVLRGHFTPKGEAADRGAETDGVEEWCDRRLLARIHRYTIDRLRSEIRPVSQSDFMKFLIRWQRAELGHRMIGPEGVMSLIEQLEGVELPGVSWETDVLPARCEEYSPEDLDALCNSGRVMWGRLSGPSGNGDGLKSTGPIRSSPIALWPREHAAFWLRDVPDPADLDLSTYARRVYEALFEHGASFFQDLAAAAHLLPTQVEQGLGELVAFGLVTSDSFSGLRTLLTPIDQRNVPSRGKRRGKTAPYGMHSAGRWSLLTAPAVSQSSDGSRASGDGRQNALGAAEGAAGSPRLQPKAADDIETWARLLLRRYGIVFRRLLKREPFAPPWRDLLRMLWRMEARGEVRGGRFVSGFSGEQFALGEAIGLLRKMRKESNDELIVVSAADPLNLTGVATPGARIPAYATNRVGYRNGVPELVLEGGEVRYLEGGENGSGEHDSGRSVPHEINKTMRRRPVAPELRMLLR